MTAARKPVRGLHKIYKLYCSSDGSKSVNLNVNEQEIIKTLLTKGDHHAYDIAYHHVFNRLRDLVTEFLRIYAKGGYSMDVKLKEKYLPFHVDPTWNVRWMTDPVTLTKTEKAKIERLRVSTRGHIARLSHDSWGKQESRDSVSSNQTGSDDKMNKLKTVSEEEEDNAHHDDQDEKQNISDAAQQQKDRDFVVMVNDYEEENEGSANDNEMEQDDMNGQATQTGQEVVVSPQTEGKDTMHRLIEMQTANSRSVQL